MEESLKRLKEARRNTQTAAMGQVVFYVLAAVLAVTRFIVPSVLCLGFALIYWFVILRKVDKEYERKVNDENLLLTVCKGLDEKNVDSGGGAGLTAQTVEEARMLPHFEAGKSVFGAYKGVSGRDRGYGVILADVSLTDTRTTEGGAKRGLMNAGCWIHMDLPVRDARAKGAPALTDYDFRLMGTGELRLVMEKDFEEKYPAYQRASSGKLALPDSVSVYAPEGAPLPDGEFFRKVKNLLSYTPGEVWMSVRDGVMDVYIRNRFLAAPVDKRREVTKEMLLEDPLPELRRVRELRDAL